MQAHALIRQEVEILARMKEYRGREVERLEGYAPRVGALDEWLRRAYNDVTSSAHVSKAHKLRSATQLDDPDWPLPDDTDGTRFYPEFDAATARQTFTVHLLLMAEVAVELFTDLKAHAATGTEIVMDEDLDQVNAALRVMIDEGVIEVN